MKYEDLLRDLARVVKKEKVLESLGLQLRNGAGHKTIGAIGWLSIGLLLVLALGEELRRELASRLGLNGSADDVEDDESLDELIT